MTNPILYEFPPTRSNRVKWVLEEVGIPYDSQIVDFTKLDQQSAGHKQVHPLGHVPAFQRVFATL